MEGVRPLIWGMQFFGLIHWWLLILQILQSGDTLIFRLRDFAPPVDREKVKPRDLEDIRPGGLGVHFIGNIMDAMRFVDPPDGRGNLLEMRKTLGQ